VILVGILTNENNHFIIYAIGWFALQTKKNIIYIQATFP
jgi:hypothetical protein